MRKDFGPLEGAKLVQSLDHDMDEHIGLEVLGRTWAFVLDLLLLTIQTT
jgi:hypothetical protein